MELEVPLKMNDVVFGSIEYRSICLNLRVSDSLLLFRAQIKQRLVCLPLHNDAKARALILFNSMLILKKKLVFILLYTDKKLHKLLKNQI